MNTNGRFYFEFGPVVQQMSFKRFLIWRSGRPPAQWSRTIYAIFFKEGVMGNIHVKIFEIWISGYYYYYFRRCCLKKKFTHDGRWTKTDNNSSP